jgi:hypothetical protein
LGVFIEIGLWRFVEALKSVENDTENPRTPPCTFPEIPGAFSGVFGTFNLESGKISEKAFSTFWKNFHFCVYRLEVDGIFLHGAKI